MEQKYSIQELVATLDSLIDQTVDSHLTVKLEKAFIRALKTALTDRTGGIFVSEKEQKRVTCLIEKLQRDGDKARKECKLLRQQLQALQVKHEKENPKKPIWWHWVMEQCRNEACGNFGYNMSQGPIHDDIGEDINLYEKIRKYEEDQKDGTTDYKCDECGHKLHMMHRHGIVDWNVIVDENDDAIRKEPLIEGVQKEGDGKYITEAEYEALKNQTPKNTTK